MQTTTDVSQRQLEILQHSLGLDEYGQGREYRNHFVTSPGGRDFDDCRALVSRELMHDHGAQRMMDSAHLFAVTDAGRRYVREHSPKPPKLTRSQRRYREYLAADSVLEFGEWLRCAR